MAVIEEYYSSGTYYATLYLDGKYVGQSSTSNLPRLFGAEGPYTYNNIEKPLKYAASWLTMNWLFGMAPVEPLGVIDIAM